MTADVSKTSGAANGEPWLAEDNGFSISKDQGYIAKTMDYLKDNHVTLTLVDDAGGVCLQSLMVNIVDGALQVDKPLDWDEEIGSFRVFFRDMTQRWNFFMASSQPGNPFSLSIVMPDALSFYQRRSSTRVKVPVGARALIRKENEKIATVFITDLSAAGMLMCNDLAEGEYDTDSIISDIVVSIPPIGAAGEVSTVRKVLPLIARGRIVRSFVDQETLRPCYGVSFHYDSKYVKESIDQVVSEVA
ncbi:MAG: PilZ domain-containing protein [Desulfobulbaceae bacterium]|nr:PilZ domain-containing protein [Desulfobulbaceae bacterium]